MRKLLFCLIFSLIIFPVFAGIEIKTTPINNLVKPGELVVYNFTISNNDDFSKTATIFLLTDKLYAINPSYIITIPARTERTISFSLLIPSGLLAQRYYEDLIFKFSDFSSATQRISYSVISPEFYLNFNELIVPEQINSMEEFNITIVAENNYDEKIKTIQAKISIFDENQNSIYYKTTLIELIAGTNNYSIPLNINEELLNDYLTINVSLNWFDINFASKQKNVFLETLQENIQMQKDNNKIIITNNGDKTSQSFEYEIQINFIEALLIKSTNIPATITSTSIIFQIPQLSPNESLILSYEIDYSIPILLIILLIILVYFSANKSVKITKEIKQIKSSHQHMSFKAVLNILNVSSNKIHQLKLKEYLPTIITDVYDFGPLKGDVKNKGRAKIIEWNIKNLKPKENVIISYRVKTKVGFIGELSLNKSVAEIFNKNSKLIRKIKIKPIIIEMISKRK